MSNSKYEKQVVNILFDVRDLALLAKNNKLQPYAYKLLSVSTDLEALLIDIREGGQK